MCGIFGQITNNPKRINDGYIKLLGIANTERGKNSCGITIDGEIYHGIDKEKLFKDFSKGRSMKPVNFPVVFGHTRQSSVGAINSDNAHPFGFGENSKGDYRMIGVHNGTLYNYEELAEKYEVSLTETKVNADGKSYVRTKIDSEILLEIIFKTQTLKVLSEYHGGAALAWYDTEEPNVLYLFCGASKDYTHSDKEEVERPLNVYVESNTNLYFSSLVEPLEIIGGDIEKNIWHLAPNTVYKIKNGNFEKAERIRISRKDAFSKKQYARSTYHNNFSQNGYMFDDYEDVTYGYEEIKQSASVIPLNTNTNSRSSEYRNIRNIEPYLGGVASYEGRIYERNLRLYRNGMPISGILIYLQNYGFFKLESSTQKDAELEYHAQMYRKFDIKNNKFIDKWFLDYTDAKKLGDLKNYPVENEIYIPLFDTDRKPVLFYVVEGVVVKEYLDYLTARTSEVVKKNGVYDYEKLSHMSVLPVVDIHTALTKANDQKILKDGKKYTGDITYLSSPRTYHIKNGNCTGITPHKIDTMMYFRGLKMYEKMLTPKDEELGLNGFRQVINNTHNSDEYITTFKTLELFGDQQVIKLKELDSAKSKNAAKLQAEKLKDLDNMIEEMENDKVIDNIPISELTLPQQLSKAVKLKKTSIGTALDHIIAIYDYNEARIKKLKSQIRLEPEDYMEINDLENNNKKLIAIYDSNE